MTMAIFTSSGLLIFYVNLAYFHKRFRLMQAEKVTSGGNQPTLSIDR